MVYCYQLKLLHHASSLVHGIVFTWVTTALSVSPTLSVSPASAESVAVLLSLFHVLWFGQREMTDDDNDKENDKDNHHDNDEHPPHVNNEVYNTLKCGRIKELL